jgi:hypothetical protein
MNPSVCPLLWISADDVVGVTPLAVEAMENAGVSGLADLGLQISMSPATTVTDVVTDVVPAATTVPAGNRANGDSHLLPPSRH